jgi:hypothetical protein
LETRGFSFCGPRRLGCLFLSGNWFLEAGYRFLASLKNLEVVSQIRILQNLSVYVVPLRDIE